MINKLKKLDYRYYICIVISIFFLSYFFEFKNSINCLIDAIIDCWSSIKYYFIKLFNYDSNIGSSVSSIPKSLENAKLPFLPKNLDLFGLKLKIYFRSLWNFDSLSFYTSSFFSFIVNILKIFIMFLPFYFLLNYQIKKYYSENEENINKETKWLIKYKKFEKKIIYPVILWVKNFRSFLVNNRKIIIFWICLWLFYFNIFSIILELLSYYLYFALSFDVLNLYIQVYKFLLYLTPLLEFFPLFIWLLILLFLFNKYRLNHGYETLEHFEMRNRGFINSTGQVTMDCGEMGTGKTSIMTDMSISQTIMFRDKALEKLLENDFRFPNFNWYNLEQFLKEKMDDHTIYNLSSIRELILKLRWFFDCSLMLDKFSSKSMRKHLKKKYGYKFLNLIFDYDYLKFGLTYDDNIKIHYIWDVIENYSCLFFVYVINTSLLVSNYSIREDINLIDLGNFPLWNIDLFRCSPIDSYNNSKFSHILDFDMLRLGKKVIENNKNSNAFEFGIVVITEVGKERKNTLELKETKKNDDEANQKNDLFNSWLKMARHLATIDNFPFIKVFMDEQRPESLGADARELCEKIVFIEEKEDLDNVLLLFFIDSIVYDLLFSRFREFYIKYKHFRSDKTLLLYLYKKLFIKFNHRYVKLLKTYGYNILKLKSEKGTLDNEFEENNYYLMHKKIYSDRFATDAFSDFFVSKSLNCNIGLSDIEEYKNVKANIEEFEKQNSFFISDIMKYSKD